MQAPAEPIDAEMFGRWRVRADDVGIDPLDTPPRSLTDIARHAGLIVSSDLTRAIESARAIVPGATIQTTPLLREIPLPIPKVFSMKLPHAMWDTLVHAHWAMNILRRADASATDIRRAVACADWLENLSWVEPRILVMTHGVFRRLLARTLRERGWDVLGRRPYVHWSLWDLTRGPTVEE
jgi:broad specificity phosphatase PhoE